MKRKVIAVIFCFVVFIAITPMSVVADIGPKPSVVIEFSNLENLVYYVTLLSKESSSGPFSLGKEVIPE